MIAALATATVVLLFLVAVGWTAALLASVLLALLGLAKRAVRRVRGGVT